MVACDPFRRHVSSASRDASLLEVYWNECLCTGEYEGGRILPFIGVRASVNMYGRRYVIVTAVTLACESLDLSPSHTHEVEVHAW